MRKRGVGRRKREDEKEEEEASDLINFNSYSLFMSQCSDRVTTSLIAHP